MRSKFDTRLNKLEAETEPAKTVVVYKQDLVTRLFRRVGGDDRLLDRAQVRADAGDAIAIIQIYQDTPPSVDLPGTAVFIPDNSRGDVL